MLTCSHRGAEEEARKKRKLELTSFAKRVEMEPSTVRDTTTYGAMTMTFVPKDVKVLLPGSFTAFYIDFTNGSFSPLPPLCWVSLIELISLCQ